MNDRGNTAGEKDGESAEYSPAGPDLQQLARDWITLWQSELTAMAVDREAHESWQAMLALWAGAAATILRASPQQGQRGDGTRGSATAAATSRSPPTSTAPDARDAEIERLVCRVGELEARLSELERGGGGDRQGPRRRRR